MVIILCLTRAVSLVVLYLSTAGEEDRGGACGGGGSGQTGRQVDPTCFSPCLAFSVSCARALPLSRAR